MIRIAIVDDSSEYLGIVQKQISKIMEEIGYEQYAVSSFNNGVDLLSDRSDYDLLLLDIDIPKINGFELTEKINERFHPNGNAAIIYISSYDNFVFESIKYSPFRFVRKNLLSSDLSEAVKAFMEKRGNSDDCFEFIDRENNAAVKIRLNDIVYFETYSHDICILDVKGTHYIVKRAKNLTLNSLEELYASKGFIRSNKSYLVNYRHIYKIQENKIYFTNGGTALITLRDVKKFKLQYQSLIMKE